ncbi:MAG: PKD domain-containing protein [Bacteroidota bacterium]
MKIRLSYLLCLSLLGLVSGVCWVLQAHQASHSLSIIQPETAQSPLRFIQNQGQWDERIQYRVDINGGNILFESNRLSYHLYTIPQAEGHGHRHDKHHSHTSDHMDHHVFRMEFLHANEQPSLVADKPSQTYHNYFLGNDPAHWAGGVHLYEMLSYEEIYPGIDIRFFGVGDALKYEFIVHPGADPTQIQLAYPGLDQIRIEDESLILETSVRTIEELPPVAYQPTKKGTFQEVVCLFSLDNGILTYQLPNGYQVDRPLIIDPTLIFSTYTGSVSNNWGFAATYDSEGNAYGAGIQRNGTVGAGYPITTGAYQTTFQGGLSDIVISKFSDDGSSLLYSTYLGGNPGGSILVEYQDLPHSIRVNANNELYIMGITNSPSFPTTIGAYDESPNGEYDIFIATLSDDGTSLLGSTLIGGSDDDGVNGNIELSHFDGTEYNYGDQARAEIVLGDSGEVYVVSSTKSGNFPIVGTPFQGTKGIGQDGCVLKFSSDLTQLLWSTFLGGSGEDAAYSVVLDPSNHVFVAGGTQSTDFPVFEGIHSSFLGGSTDGFIVKLSQHGDSLLSGTYIGTDAYDQTFLLDLDQNGNVYVIGQTEGTYPVINPPEGPVYANTGAKQFISKLNHDLASILFSTTFGPANTSRPSIAPVAFGLDHCHNIYVSGWGGSTNQHGSTNGMPTTSDAYQSTTDGSDFYTLVLSENAQSLMYGSYIGGMNGNGQAGDHADGASSHFDEYGVLYQAVCAGCWGVSTFPATNSAYSTTNNATTSGNQGCNLLVFKFDFEIANIRADFSYTVAFDEVSFQNNTSPDGTYMWDFGDGSSSTQISPSHTYQDTGTYLVRLIADLGNECVIDTVIQEVTISQLVGIAPDHSLKVKVYPNPASDILVVSAESAIVKGEIQLMNIAGHMLRVHAVDGQESSFRETLDVRQLPEGVYILRILSRDTPIHLEKLLIRR